MLDALRKVEWTGHGKSVGCELVHSDWPPLRWGVRLNPGYGVADAARDGFAWMQDRVVSRTVDMPTPKGLA